MRAYRIIGGPGPSQVKVLDPDGKDISGEILSLDVHMDGCSLSTVRLQAFADVDVLVEREE